MLQEFFTSWSKDATNFCRNKSWTIFIAPSPATRERRYFLKFKKIIKKPIRWLRSGNYTEVPIRQLLTSVILVMAFCSMKTESWASKRTSSGSTLSPCIPSPKVRSSLAEYFFPKSMKKWSFSFLKKSWNPSCTHSMIKSVKLDSTSKFSSRSRRESCYTKNQTKSTIKNTIDWTTGDCTSIEESWSYGASTPCYFLTIAFHFLKILGGKLSGFRSILFRWDLSDILA